MEVFFGVYADGVEVGGFDVDVDAVFEEAELLQALSALELAGRQRGEEMQRSLAVGVEADVLPVFGCGVVVGVAVVGMMEREK